MKIRKEIKIGAYLLVTLAVFFWGLSFLKGKNLLKRTDTYYIVYDKVGGLQGSAAVIANGLQVGIVEDLRFMQDNRKIQVTILIEGRYKIPRGSLAKIYSSDIMGTKAIEIVLSDRLDYYQSGDTLTSAIEPDLKEEINIQLVPLKLKAEELMGSVDSVLVIMQAIFNEGFRDKFSGSIDNISRTINSLERSMSAIDTILTDENSQFSIIMSNLASITTNLKQNNEEISQIFSNLSSITDTLAKAEVQSTIHNLNLALEEANGLLAKISRGEGSAGALINDPQLYENLSRASASLDRLLIDFRNNPRRYVSVSLINLGGKSRGEEAQSAASKE
jgi:phospholipid/cholesterol/gamma-HCH transport system substrate-binding protein